MIIKSSVKGLRQLGETLSRMANKDAVNICRSATASGAIVIKKIAKAKAHVAEKAYTVRTNKNDEGILVQPGNVPKNIVTKRNTRSKLTSEHIVAVRGKRKYGYANRVGIFLEFGTVRMQAYPFMRPSLSIGRGRAIDAMKKKIAIGIAKTRVSK
jgi:HK97 gp10 family phage protein